MIEGPRRQDGAFVEQLVVLDDDPTGVQTLAGIRVLLDWDPGRIAGALAGRRSVHLITNSRARRIPARGRASVVVNRGRQ